MATLTEFLKDLLGLKAFKPDPKLKRQLEDLQKRKDERQYALTVLTPEKINLRPVLDVHYGAQAEKYAQYAMQYIIDPNTPVQSLGPLLKMVHNTLAWHGIVVIVDMALAEKIAKSIKAKTIVRPASIVNHHGLYVMHYSHKHSGLGMATLPNNTPQDIYTRLLTDLPGFLPDNMDLAQIVSESRAFDQGRIFGLEGEIQQAEQLHNAAQMTQSLYAMSMLFMLALLTKLIMLVRRSAQRKERVRADSKSAVMAIVVKKHKAAVDADGEKKKAAAGKNKELEEVEVKRHEERGKRPRESKAQEDKSEDQNNDPSKDKGSPKLPSGANVEYYSPSSDASPPQMSLAAYKRQLLESENKKVKTRGAPGMPALALDQDRQRQIELEQQAAEQKRLSLLEKLKDKPHERDTFCSILDQDYATVKFHDLERLLQVLTIVESKIKGHYSYPNLHDPKVNEKVLHRNDHENISPALESLHGQFVSLGITRDMVAQANRKAYRVLIE